MAATHPTIEDVAGDLLREEHRLSAVEDRLRRLELEAAAGDVHLVARALSRTREVLHTIGERDRVVGAV